jgi:hypothetical protein
VSVWTVLEVEGNTLTAQLQTDDSDLPIPNIPIWRQDIEFAVAWLMEQGGGKCVITHMHPDSYMWKD